MVLIFLGVESIWKVYVVRCSTGEFYTGCTTDLKRRIGQHNRGSGSKYTRSRRPVVLIYEEACADRSAALKREIQIKKMSRVQKFRLIHIASAVNA
jgi:putative endonuclease